MRYAVDFDGTLQIKGKPNTQLISSLRQLQMQGNFIILHTSRTGKHLIEAVNYCKKQGLIFNQVVGGKPIADMYIDDKAVNPFR